MRPRAQSVIWVAGTVVVCGLAVGATVRKSRTAAREVVLDRPIEVQAAGYISSDKCQSCHPGNYGTWKASYHRSMTRKATPETVKGDFDDAAVVMYERQDDGTVVEQPFRFTRTGDRFYVEMNDPTAPPGSATVREEVVLITGSHHMQVYWYPSGRGRMLEMMPMVYLLEDQRWVPFGTNFLQPTAGIPPPGAARWNKTCIICHTTQSQPRMSERGYFDSYVAEFGISCEECHGPAEEHVAHNHDPRARLQRHLDDDTDDTIVNPLDLPHRLDSQVCGQCHGISFFKEREEMLAHHTGPGPSYVPGANFDDTHLVVQPTRIDENEMLQRKAVEDPEYFERHFWPDGMVRVSGREFNMLEQSPCFAGEDFSCMSCHQLHQRDDDPRPIAEWANDMLRHDRLGDAACLQCHVLPDVAAHTHHAVESSGSLCMNCHMPYTTYGLLKAIRSHQISSPTVAASLETGRPNACNQCHLDRSLAWTADFLEKWYEIPVPELTLEQEETAASVLWTLTGDAAQRALMAWSMGWESAREASGSEWMPPYLANLLDDPYAAVRYIAYRSLRSHEGFEDFEYDHLDRAPRGRDIVRVQDLWSRLHDAGAFPEHEAMLIGPDGRLRQGRFAALKARRDDRFVLLSE